MEVSCMSSGGGVMYGVGDGLLFVWGDVHVTLEVQMAVGHMPIIYRRVGEQRGSCLQPFQGLKH